MSKKVKKSRDNKEPWEQSIYDTEYDDHVSRTQQRKTKRGNTVFLTILVILLVLIVAIPSGFLIWMSRPSDSGKTTASTSTTSSSVVQSSSTTESSTSVSTTEPSSSTTEPSSESTEPSSSEVDQAQQEADAAAQAEADALAEQQAAQDAEDAAAEYAQIQSGEGLYRFAINNGVTLAQVMELNGITDADNYPLQPGQSLRIR